jgi:hypothetical protein
MGIIKSTVVAGILACMIGTAHADEITGTVDDINLTRNRITVGGKSFAMSPHNTVGVKIGDLKIGDRVRVFYASGRVPSETRFNAMRVEKEGN